jgi:hypothetical protein
VSKKKNKFDLTHLVHQGLVKDGEVLKFVSDPSKSCTIARQPNGEYKVKVGPEIMTIHAFVQKCLGQEAPDHASKWLRASSNSTLYELWHEEDYQAAA